MLKVMLLVFSGLLLAALFYLVWYFSRLVIYPKTYTREYAMSYDLERGKFDQAYWSALNKEAFVLDSPHGYQLSGYYVPQSSGSPCKGVAVICHGITWNLVGSIKYLPLFYNQGMDVVLYDHRNHGESGGNLTSFGAYEVDDLNQVLDWVEEKRGKGAFIATHGESMGAAIVLQQLATDNRVKACVADCGFSDLTELLDYRLKVSYPWLKLPMLALVRPWIRLVAGFDMTQISPMKASQNVTTPILWIHGDADDYIPPEMSIAMHDAKQGKKELLIVNGAKHAGAFTTDPKLYQKTVNAFLEPLLEAVNESSN